MSKRVTNRLSFGAPAPRMIDGRDGTNQQPLSSAQFEQSVLDIIRRALGGTLIFENGKIVDKAKGVLSQAAGSPVATVLNHDETLSEVNGKLHAQPSTKDVVAFGPFGDISLQDVIDIVSTNQSIIRLDIEAANLRNKQIRKAAELDVQRVVSSGLPFSPEART